MKLCFANHLAWCQRWKIVVMALVAACFCWGWVASAATLSASLDRDSMTLEDTATLTLTFQDGAPDIPPSFRNIPGLTISYAGASSQTSFSIIGANTQKSISTTYQYEITAQRPGAYTIPALSVEVDGARLESQPLSLAVSRPTAPTSDQAVFVKLALSKKQMYVGEMATAELQIWLRDDIQHFGNLQLPAMPSDGFNVGKMSARSNYRAQLNNRVYTVVPVAIAITAIKSGTLTIGPLNAQFTIVLPYSNQQNMDPLQRFFNQGERKDISLNTETYTVQGLKLPPNPPAGFNGAVGKFQMAVTEGPATVSAGDPITVHVRIEGRGTLDSVKLPDFSAWNGFKTYPASAKTDATDQLGLEGVKNFEEIITPQNADVREIPAFSFTYFDPNQQKYETLSQAAMPITVRAAGAMPVPSVPATKPAGQENTATQSDLLPVKQNLGRLIASGTPLLARPAFLTLQSAPVLAFLAALLWRRHTDNLANNPKLRRKRLVAQLMGSGLVDLRKFAGANDSEQFFATLFRLLQEQLGERLDCPASAITEAAVDERLIALNAPAQTLAGLRELFQLCNQARYAPVRDPQELAAVAAKFETVTREIQALKA
jgi:hypothetical protein